MRPQILWYRRPKFFAARAGEVDEFGLQCKLPWGSTLSVDPREVIGRRIIRNGVFDLEVCEAICRLVKPKDTVVDVGANSGQMATLMAKLVGTDGRVLCYEPHPDNYNRLSWNLSLMHRIEGLHNVEAQPLALGDANGEAILSEPLDLELNSGTCTLLPPSGGHARSYTVAVRKFDSLHLHSGNIALMKLDVEGFELSVLKGADYHLRSGAIEHIIFEEHKPSASNVIPYLEDRGYATFSLTAKLLKPRLTRVRVGHIERRVGSNFLATLSPQSVQKSFRRPGYRTFAL